MVKPLPAIVGRSALFAAFVGLLVVVVSVHAEDGKTYSYHSVPLARGPQQSAEEIEDIGEIRSAQDPAPLKDKFRYSVTVQGQFTNNALLNGNGGSSDFIFLPTVQVGFRTPLGKHFNFDVSAQVDSANYANYDERSFAGYSAIATLDYQIKPGLPRLYASISPYRYDSYDTGDLMSSAVGFSGGTDWGVPFNAGRSLAFVGYSFTDYVSDPNIDTRLVNRAVIGVAHQFRSNLTGQIYYTYQYSNFTDFPRSDSRNVVAGNLIYQVSEHAFVSLITSFVDNDSTEDNASFQGFGVSLGVNLQY